MRQILQSPFSCFCEFPKGLRCWLVLLALQVSVWCSPLWSDQALITIDGDFSDWSGVAPSFSDPQGDGGSSGIDFGVLRIADDDRHLYLQLELGTSNQLDEDNNLVLYLDTDNNSTTGLSVNGIGAELEWRLGQRNGDFDPPIGSTAFVFHEDIRFRSAPTVASTVHEVAIGRDTLPNGNQPLFSSSTIRLLIRDETPGGDRLPNLPGGVSYTFDVGGPISTEVIPLEREQQSDLRLLTWNVLNDSPWNSGSEARFGRVLFALRPDIVAFQEVGGHSATEAAALVANWVTASGGTWVGVGNSDCKLVSRFPILGSWAIAGNQAVLIDTTSEWGHELLIINAHLPCCGNQAGRQAEVDQILEFLREAKSIGGVLDLAPETPFLITGDLNLVQLSQPLTSLLTGDIIENFDHGSDFAPDWDGSDLHNVLPRQTELGMGYTWRNDQSSFWPGHLDYWIVSDSVLELGRSFTLYTPEMSQSSLSSWGLQASDTLASDHLPFVLDLRPPSPVGGAEFVRADCNTDGFFDLSDAIWLLEALFNGGSLDCVDACDANDDGAHDLADVITILTYQFSGGPAPLAPYPNCGSDPTNDALDCTTYGAC